MSGQGRAHYLSMGKRGFKQAVIRLLETEYKIVGSHKVIQMIAEDIGEPKLILFEPRGFYSRALCVKQTGL